jgi:O-antigen/teichoic acid export membrane protein
MLPISFYVVSRHKSGTIGNDSISPAAGIFSRGALSYNAPLVLIALCFWLQNYGYRLIVADQAGTEVLGIFTIGFTIGMMPVLLITKISNDYLVPILYRDIAHAGQDTRLEAWKRFAGHYIPAGLIAAPMLAASAHFYCRFLVAPAYWQYAWLAWFGAAFQLIFTIYSAHIQLAQTMMENKTIVMANLVSGFVIILLTFALARFLPLAGPGIALITGGVVLASLVMHKLYRQYKVIVPAPPLLYSAALGAAGAATVSSMTFLLPTPSLLQSAFAVFLTGIMTLGCFYLFLRKYPL